MLIDSDGKIQMHYVVSDTDPDVGYGTRGTMAVTLTASETVGFVAIGFPDESGGMVGSQAVVGIPKYNMIVTYDLKGCDDQAALTDEHQTITDDSVEAVDGDIVLKFNNFLVEEGENDIIVEVPQNFVYAFSDTVGEVHGSNRGKYVINISSGGTSKIIIPMKASG